MRDQPQRQQQPQDPVPPQECVPPPGRAGIVKPCAAQNQPGENKLDREAGQQIGFELPSHPYVLATEVTEQRALKRIKAAVQCQEAGQPEGRLHRARLRYLTGPYSRAGKEAERQQRHDSDVRERGQARRPRRRVQ